MSDFSFSLGLAARELCRLRGFDPDQNIGGWTTNQDVAEEEIKRHMQIQQAINTAVARVEWEQRHLDRADTINRQPPSTDSMGTNSP
jgi:hypothetical protein